MRSAGITLTIFGVILLVITSNVGVTFAVIFTMVGFELYLRGSAA